MSKTLYSDRFFSDRSNIAQNSASEIVPILYDNFKPQSVIDIGCGLGGWLRRFMATGVETVVGLDGKYVDTAKLEIPKECFVPVDLGQLDCFPGEYDLALSLEVAEHLPPSSADRFARLLSGLAPIIVFSAAVPGQAGVGHVNCQWPPYWFERFRDQGFEIVDSIRPKIWQNTNVAPWYQQNIFVVAKPEVIDANSSLREAPVYPFSYPTLLAQEIAWKADPTVKQSVRQLVAACGRSFRRRMAAVLPGGSRQTQNSTEQ